MPVMNFDLEDGKPAVSFSINTEGAERFMAFMAECQEIRNQATPVPAAGEQGAGVMDAQRLDWLDQNIFSTEMDEFDKELHRAQWAWRMYAPENVQGDARKIIDAAILAAAAPQTKVKP